MPSPADVGVTMVGMSWEDLAGANDDDVINLDSDTVLMWDDPTEGPCAYIVTRDAA